MYFFIKKSFDYNDSKRYFSTSNITENDFHKSLIEKNQNDFNFFKLIFLEVLWFYHLFLCTKFFIYLPLFFFLSFLDFLPSDRALSSPTGSAEHVTKETDLSSYDHLFFLPQVAVRELGSKVASLQVKVQV